MRHRSVTPFIECLRTLLRRRKPENSLRYADLLAARTQPPPDIPDGPYHKTSKIYYHSRDARREVEPPTVIDITKQIAAESAKSSQIDSKRHFVPGKVIRWD